MSASILTHHEAWNRSIYKIIQAHFEIILILIYFDCILTARSFSIEDLMPGNTSAPRIPGPPLHNAGSRLSAFGSGVFHMETQGDLLETKGYKASLITLDHLKIFSYTCKVTYNNYWIWRYPMFVILLPVTLVMLFRTKPASAGTIAFFGLWCSLNYSIQYESEPKSSRPAKC